MQGVSFEFDEQCNQALCTLKEKLVLAPTMVTLDWELPFELMCDASNYTVGAMLGQKNDKVFYAIYYARKTLNEAQIKYATKEK